MPAREIHYWLLTGVLALACIVALLAIHAGFSASVARLLTWILSTEILPLALIAGAAWIIHLLWRSHHTWRQK